MARIERFEDIKAWKSASILLLTLLLSCVGCVRSIHLKVIDSDTGLPIKEVSTEWLSWHEAMFVKADAKAPTNLPLCASDGIINIYGIGSSKWRSAFIFSHPGYATNYGYWRGAPLILSDKVETGPLLPVMPMQQAAYSNAFYFVPMTKTLR